MPVRLAIGHASGALKDLQAQLHGEYNPTRLITKYKGNPSIVFGHHEGKFFVATKEQFEKGLLSTSPKEIESRNANRTMSGVMKTALLYLQKAAPNQGIYHGEVLSFETDEEKPEKSSLTLAVSGKLHGHDLSNMHSNHEPDVHRFKKSSHVTVVSPETEFGLVAGGDQLKADHHLRAASKEEPNPEVFAAVAPHSVHLRRYASSAASKGETTSVQGYNKYLMDAHETDSKSVNVKAKTNEQLKHHMAYVNDNQRHFEKVFKLHSHLQKTKNTMLNAFLAGGADPDEVGSPQGFIVIHEGVPMQMVDRKKDE